MLDVHGHDRILLDGHIGNYTIDSGGLETAVLNWGETARG
jgi:hypothetical protein